MLAAGFACQFLLTRLLTLPEYAIYVFAVAWIRTLGVPAVLGLERLIVREVAALKAVGNWPEWRGLVRWSQHSALAASVAIAVVTAATAWLVFPEQSWSPTLILAAWLLPLLTVTRVQQFIVQGMGHPILSQLAEALVLPTVFAAALIGWYLLTGHLSVRRVMLMNVIATATALATATVILTRLLPDAVRRVRPAPQAARWSRSLAPLLLTTGAASITAQIPTLMLGLLDGRARDLALFAIARSLSDLALIPVLALIPIWSPLVAALWRRGERHAVQVTATIWARRIAWLYLPVFAVLMIFAEPILRIFGPPFAGAETALRILSVGYLVNLLAGWNGIVLVTAGHEREVAVVSLACAALCGALCALLIPSAALTGAAIAAAVTMAVTNIALAGLCHIRLGIMPTVFASVGTEQPADKGVAGQQA